MKTKTKIIKDDINIIGIFCIVDDVLKNLGLKDDVRAEAYNSEILSIAILAFLFFGGNFKKALSFVLQQNLFTKISYSRLKLILIISYKANNFVYLILLVLA
jgi:hypothetical protein